MQCTTMEKNVDTLFLILGGKVTTPPPLLQCNDTLLIQVMLSEVLPDPPTLIGGGGEGLR